MKFQATIITLLFVCFTATITAQERYKDAIKIIDDINTILRENDPSLKRFDSVAFDSQGNLIIFDNHKTLNNTTKHTIQVSQLSLKKLKVVKFKKPPFSKNAKGAQVLITSDKGKAVKHVFFKKFQKEYRLTVASKEKGEALVKLLKMVLKRYDPS